LLLPPLPLPEPLPPPPLLEPLPPPLLLPELPPLLLPEPLPFPELLPLLLPELLPLPLSDALASCVADPVAKSSKPQIDAHAVTVPAHAALARATMASALGRITATPPGSTERCRSRRECRLLPRSVWRPLPGYSRSVQDRSPPPPPDSPRPGYRTESR
jgi:hypothetical protein